MLPDELQKSLPDRPPEMKQQGIDGQEGFPRATGKTSPMPRRNPPPPPSAAESNQNVSPSSHNSKAGGTTGPIGAFWNTQHAATASGSEETSRPKFDEEIRHNSSSHDKSHPNKVPASYKTSPSKEESLSSHPIQNNVRAKPANRAGEASSKDFEINFFQDECQSVGSDKSSKLEGSTVTQGEALNAFVAEFSTNRPSPRNNTKQPEKKELLEAEVEKLKEQLSRANMEKAEITSKFEKLSAICRSQRQEIQELKQALAVSTPSPNRDTSRDQASPGSQPSSVPPPRKDNIEGTVWELEQGLFGGSQVSPDSKPWQAFADDDPKQQLTSVNANPRSVRTKNGHQNRQTSETNTSGFGTDSFRAVPASSSQIKATFNESKNYQRFGEPKNVNSKSASQPAGWAGF